MKMRYPYYSIARLCDLFGKTRQAYHKVSRRAEARDLRHGEILAFVRQERKDQPKIGVQKLKHMLQGHLAIKIGRDALYNLLRDNNLLVKPRKKYRPPSTNGDGSSIYPDLRKTLIVSAIHQLWSCDITYLSIENGRSRHCYATFLIDEYSHLIVGFVVSQDMTAQSVLLALKSAVNLEVLDEGHQLVFHTDRGSQFKSAVFQNYLATHQITSSMTQDGKPADNPVSERLNGIIKNELINQDTFEDYEQAKQMISRAVHIYNTRRPHLSCEMLTPDQAHQQKNGPLKKLWRQRKKNKANSRSNIGFGGIYFATKSGQPSRDG